ncbi:MAG: transglycosylase SLT domain-containing protein [Betaproteobacteria bacterium]|nr:transglycosylase SLT domain-containing protein [Betaproteobacteria bacterium]
MSIRTAVLGLVALFAAACAEVPLAPDVQREAPVPPVARDTESVQAQREPVVPAAPKATEPPPPANLWTRVRSGYRLPDTNGPLVTHWEQWYSSRPDYVARMVERSGRYLYHVMEEVERRKMPAEIALLPMIESAYNPQAYSRSHASGMWQFIPSTGKLYGLRQNFWYDGRRDVLAATGAALDYLEKLHTQFGDWGLALAAYNWGEGAVSRAIAKNQAKGLPADYESLTLPLETRNYMPKLQAVKNIVADPERLGLQLADVPNEPYFTAVTTRRHIDVQLAATLAEMPLEEFRFLNPAHNKPVIKADGSENIVPPRHKVEVFQRNLETHDQPLVSWQAYTVKRSDKPELIAKKHGISLAQLKEINGINGKKRIVAGQTLMVPLRGTAEPHLPDLPAPKITRARYQPKKARCVQAVKGGKKQMRCAASARKVPAARKSTARQPANRTQVTIPRQAGS